MLAPVVVIGALAIRMMADAEESDGPRPPIVPTFVMGFIVLAVLNSFGAIPEIVTEGASSVSRWLLLIAISAVGLKTMPQEVLKVGPKAAALLVAETLFLALLVSAGILFVEV